MADRRTLFLTGAAGVIGAALLPTLRQYRVITLVHRSLPAGGEHLRGDLTLPRFGLGQRAFDGLCAEVDAVVHCAAVWGTRHVLELCSAARAPLLQVDSAFIEPRQASQQQQLEHSGIPHFIARLSLLIGDSLTGEIARFQGFHAFATGILRGRVRFVPGHPDTQLDLLPQDVVASSLKALLVHGLERGFDGSEYWLTSGPESLTLARMLELVREAGAFADLEVALPRLVPHGPFERVSLPSSLGAFPGSPARPSAAELESALSASLHYLLRAKGLGIHGKRYRAAQPSDSRSES